MLNKLENINIDVTDAEQLGKFMSMEAIGNKRIFIKIIIINFLEIKLFIKANQN
jgi:hypothetical protein